MGAWVEGEGVKRVGMRGDGMEQLPQQECLTSRGCLSKDAHDQPTKRFVHLSCPHYPRPKLHMCVYQVNHFFTGVIAFVDLILITRADTLSTPHALLDSPPVPHLLSLDCVGRGSLHQAGAHAIYSLIW